jgi:hypothetical protein
VDKRLLVAGLILGVALVAFAQAPAVTLTKVYVGKDGLAHVVDSSGKDEAVPKEKEQAEISDLKLSPDKRAAGWLMHQGNLGESYTIPVGLVVYRVEKKRLLLGDELMVYGWCFVGQGEQVAMSTGTVHGQTDQHLLLYDTSTGKQLKEWNGPEGATPPEWAKGLQQ